VIAVTAAVTSTCTRRESVVGGGGVTSDDVVDGHMTKTDTCFSLLSPDLPTTIIPNAGNRIKHVI